MKKKFSETTKSEQIMYIIRWILQIAVVLILAYIVFLRVKMGQHIPMPLIGCAFLVILGLFHISSIHKRHQSTIEEHKKFNQIVVRSIILAPIIVAIFLTIIVLIKLKIG